jgi:sn-1 stearoyl-lipid 9-desaturase
LLIANEPKPPLKWSTLSIVILFHLIAVGFGIFTFSIPNFIAFFILYVITGLGITLGYHRLFTHNSFVVNNSVLKVIIAIAGTLALQGSVIDWVVDHFQHHNYSDKKPDPHSSNEGFLWSHLLWLFYPIEDNAQQAKLRTKLNEDKILYFFDQYPVFVGMQFLLGFALLMIGGWGMVIWGVFVRTVFVWHVTWFINSACHFWGQVEFDDTDDNSKNLWWMAILANGEGWHNNHHKFQASPKHGLRWYQIDLTWWIINSLDFVGLVSVNRKLIPIVPKK